MRVFFLHGEPSPLSLTQFQCQEKICSTSGIKNKNKKSSSFTTKEIQRLFLILPDLVPLTIDLFG